ncbi:ABC transporter ATP-binding protein [Pseudomonas simiae]|uniref:ABC transporter ATP-binding protein n=1 Tax=Pseudomonas simiae TaxID=321846 RepID=UPI001616B56F|nr:ABC transporter ATP-binding protein [Pseudomonas simiae]
MSSNITVDKTTPSISVIGVSKNYHIYAKPEDRLKQFIFSRVFGDKKHLFYKNFWALNPVSFDVNKGDSVGIVGRNGSGKSTLLQMICGTLTPSTGTIQKNGRIAALLELGAGFNPDFTGRENIYLNGSILGLSKKEIDERFSAIVDFSEIEQYIDQQVKTYSSGMFIRLAFSVAIHSNPEILIIDEALAVGDVFFQQKCFERLKQLKEAGITLLFVSHDVTSVKLLCDKAILLHKGNLIKIGDPKDVVNEYIKINSKDDELPAALEAPVSEVQNPSRAVAPPPALSALSEPLSSSTDEESEYRYGNKSAIIEKFAVYNEQGVLLDGSIHNDEPVEIRLTIKFFDDIENPVAGFYIKDRRGIELYSGNTHYLGYPLGKQSKGNSIQVSFRQVISLAPAEYSLSLGLSNYIDGVSTPLDRRYEAAKLTILADQVIIGLFDLKSKVQLEYLK